MSLIDCGSDYGAYVRGAIESGLEDGSEVLACRQEITMPEFAEIWGQGESPTFCKGFEVINPGVYRLLWQFGTSLTDHSRYFVRSSDYFTPRHAHSFPSFLRSC